MAANSLKLSQHFGRVIYLMGPSGSGKDTLINALRKKASMNQRIHVADRYITRLPSKIRGGENHIEISHQEFENRVKLNAFAMNWRAHDTDYAVSADIDLWLAVGSHVLVNGSREYLPVAQKLYPNLVPMWLNVDAEVLQQRLQSRGRETAVQIAERIERNAQFDSHRPDDALVINNNGDIADTLKNLEQVLADNLPQVTAVLHEAEARYAEAV